MEHALDREELGTVRRKARTATLRALSELGGEATRAEITLQARAVGDFTPRELAAPGPPKQASRVEFELSWALTHLKREGLLLNPRRSVWALAAPTPAASFGPPAAATSGPPASRASFGPPVVATIAAPSAPPSPGARRRPM